MNFNTFRETVSSELSLNKSFEMSNEITNLKIRCAAELLKQFLNPYRNHSEESETCELFETFMNWQIEMD